MSKRHTSIFTGLTLSLAVFSGALGIFSGNASAASKPIYRVLAVTYESADTFYVVMNGKMTKIRLIGVDAPEATSRFDTKKGCYATQAKDVLKKIILNRYVSLASDPKMPDKYTDGSLLRYAYVGAQDVGGMMVYNGAAREYMYQHKNYAYRSWYKSLQSAAETSKRGLWKIKTCTK